MFQLKKKSFPEEFQQAKPIASVHLMLGKVHIEETEWLNVSMKWKTVADSEWGRLGCHIKGEINAWKQKWSNTLSASWIPYNDVQPLDTMP